MGLIWVRLHGPQNSAYLWPCPMQTINIVVRDQSGGEVHFKVKPNTKFTKVFDAYCNKKAVGADSMKFLFDGDRVQKEMTPTMLEMNDGDVIDAVVEQQGGR